MVDAVCDDYRTAPIAPHLVAVLGLLEKLSRTPEEVTAADIAQVREHGVSVDAIRDAMYISALFHVQTRVSRALDYDPVVGEEMTRAAPILWRTGYAVPPPAPWRRWRPKG